MKTKKSRIYGIVGLALIVSALSLVFFPQGEDEETQQQTTSVDKPSRTVRLAQARIEQRPAPQPVEVTLGGFKSSWYNEK